MENRSFALLTGLFTLLLGAALVITFIWFRLLVHALVFWFSPAMAALGAGYMDACDTAMAGVGFIFHQTTYCICLLSPSLSIAAAAP